MKAVKGRVKGRVQGVGFRYFTQEQARVHCISGYVKNTSDGDVVFLIQGEEEKIENMLTLLGEGPSMAKVNSLTYEQCTFDASIREFEVQ